MKMNLLVVRIIKLAISVAFAIVAQILNTENRGCFFEGCSVWGGFPFQHTTSMAGFPYTNYLVLAIDYLIIITVVYVFLSILHNKLAK